MKSLIKPTKRVIILSMFAIPLFLSGCMGMAWIGFKNPQGSDYVTINVNANCMRIATQNLDERQKKAVLEAAADVCEIFNSNEFQKEVTSKKWLASCDETDGKPDEIDGAAVFSAIMKKIADYSVHPQKPYGAIAQTQRDELNPIYNRVAIKPRRIEAWYSTVDTVKSELVNTIAHETMHIISFDFADSGHGTKKCPDIELVSYGIGNLVEKIWLSGKR